MDPNLALKISLCRCKQTLLCTDEHIQVWTASKHQKRSDTQQQNKLQKGEMTALMHNGVRSFKTQEGVDTNTKRRKSWVEEETEAGMKEEASL